MAYTQNIHFIFIESVFIYILAAYCEKYISFYTTMFTINIHFQRYNKLLKRREEKNNKN